MIKIYLRNILRFFVVVFLQVLLFDNVELNGYINPYFYVIFIILLPFESPKEILLTIAFLLGLTMDLLYMTPGIHTSAAVFMAFLRPFVLQSFAPRDGYDPGTFPRVHYYGFRWFGKYTFLLVLAHHFLLFSVEVFSMKEFPDVILRTVLSSFLTTGLILISQYFIYRK